jgi:hypothetical protein
MVILKGKHDRRHKADKLLKLYTVLCSLKSRYSSVSIVTVLSDVILENASLNCSDCKKSFLFWRSHMEIEFQARGLKKVFT